MSNVIWKRITKQRQARLERAAALFNARQAREVHPDGTFGAYGIWQPSDAERQTCCEKLRMPTRRWPYSLIQHCRTATHVAQLCDVPKAALKETALANRWETGYLPVYYTDGAFRSCVDLNVYRLGQEMPTKPMPEQLKTRGVLNARERRVWKQQGAYEVYATPDAAMKDALSVSVYPTHILKVQVAGRHAASCSGRSVYERLKPIDIATDVGSSRIMGGTFQVLLPQHETTVRIPILRAATLDIAIGIVLDCRLPIGTKLYSYLYRKPVWELTPAIAEFLDKAACWAVGTAELLQPQQTRWCS